MEGRKTQANQQRPQPASATQVVGKNGMEEGDGVNFPAQKGNGVVVEQLALDTKSKLSIRKTVGEREGHQRRGDQG